MQAFYFNVKGDREEIFRKVNQFFTSAPRTYCEDKFAARNSDSYRQTVLPINGLPVLCVFVIADHIGIQKGITKALGEDHLAGYVNSDRFFPQ